MSIHLHIDRLVVDGLPMTPPQVRALRASVETHLADLLSAAPPRASGYAVPTLPATPIVWNGAATANTTGRSIARSLHSLLAPNAHSDRRSR